MVRNGLLFSGQSHEPTGPFKAPVKVLLNPIYKTFYFLALLLKAEWKSYVTGSQNHRSDFQDSKFKAQAARPAGPQQLSPMGESCVWGDFCRTQRLGDRRG